MTTRTPLDMLVTHATLCHMVQKGDFMHLFPDEELEGKVKNVCAKVSVQLSDEVDKICGLLDISKRKFLEAAMLEAVERAKEIIEVEGLWDYLEERDHLTRAKTTPEETE